MLLKQTVEQNTLCDLSCSFQAGDSTIVLHLCFITIFKGWNDICTFPFQWDLSSFKVQLKRLQKDLAMIFAANFSTLACMFSQLVALQTSPFFNRSVTLLTGT